jgi:hypothetical protein
MKGSENEIQKGNGQGNIQGSLPTGSLALVIWVSKSSKKKNQGKKKEISIKALGIKSPKTMQHLIPLFFFGVALPYVFNLQVCERKIEKSEG